MQSIIHSFSSSKSDCDFCLSKNVDWCDPRELQNYFVSILELYITSSDITRLGIDIRDKELFIGPLGERICIDFPDLVFKSESLMFSSALINSIFVGIEDYERLLNENVGLEHLFNESGYEGSNRLIASWNNFVDEIKTKNRFHLSSRVDLSSLERVLSNYVRHYPVGKIFYRGRISDKSGFDKNSMGHPPANRAKAGRANPAGISYLYVAESAREICDGLRRKISIQRRTFSVTWRSSAFLNDLDSDAICKTIVRLLCQNLTVAIKVIERLRETRIFASAASKNSENCLHIAK